MITKQTRLTTVQVFRKSFHSSLHCLLQRPDARIVRFLDPLALLQVNKVVVNFPVAEAADSLVRTFLQNTACCKTPNVAVRTKSLHGSDSSANFLHQLQRLQRKGL